MAFVSLSLISARSTMCKEIVLHAIVDTNWMKAIVSWQLKGMKFVIRAVKFGIGTVTPVLSAHSDGTLLATGVKKSLMIAKIMIRKMVPVPIVTRATPSKMINVLRLKQIIVRKKSTGSVSFVILVIE
jgi:hypothetical protein